jgi:hypothetical protein
MDDKFEAAARALRKRLGAAPVVTDWAPDETGALVAGTLALVESEARQDRDGNSFETHSLVIDDTEDGARYRVKVEGRAMKAWFTANRDVIKPGVLVGVRFDGTRASGEYEWREYTVKPDARDGDSFTTEDEPPF